MTDAEMKEKLIRVWANHKYLDVSGYWQEYNVELLKEDCGDITIQELQALMIKDGVDPAEINKIMEGL